MERKALGRPPIGPKPEGDTGRHSFLTDSEREKVVSTIKGGGGKIMACEIHAITYGRFLRSYREDAGFREAVDNADTIKDEIALAVIYDGVAQGKSERSAETYLKVKNQTRAMNIAAVEARKNRKLKEREIEMARGGKRDDSRPDLSKLTVEELREYRRLLAKLGVPDEEPGGITIDVEGGPVPDAEPSPDPQP